MIGGPPRHDQGHGRPEPAAKERRRYQTSTGDPAGWYANLVASKGGNPLAIVMLGLLDDNDAAMPLCPPESPDPANLRALVDMFPTHIRGSVCEPSYNAFFEQAVELIAVACEQFDPA